MGKYDNLSSLNVLAEKKASEYMSDDCIADVANLLKAKGGNRSQRRRLEKSLGRVETIYRHAQKRVDDNAYKEYQKCVDMNYLHFFACLGLCMMDKYGWKETPDNDHGQVSSLLENVDKTIVKYAKEGYETQDIVNLFEERTGICLVPNN